MYLIDTNIHTAYLLQEDFEKDESTKNYLQLFNTIPLSQRVATDFILGEFETLVVQAIPRRFRLNLQDTKKIRRRAFEYIDKLLDECTIIVPEPQIVRVARNLYFENANAHYISFVDCLILATAELHKFTIFTKDKRMKSVAKNLHIECLEP